ncbi:hypothetical protein R5R35_000977 [Gryllus longicercus]|uniref:Uncharacterized protein n=1 Tax=Gryllus longicercus TaxID=2509291 RepID=A0AAN9VYP4_9ORTH
MAGASPKSRPVITYGQRESHGRWEGAEEEEGEPLGVVAAHGGLREASARDVDTSSHQPPATCLPRAVANARTSAPRVRSAAPNASALMTAPAGQARQRTLPVTPQSHANARKESPVDVLRPLAYASRPEDKLSMASNN